MNDTGSLDPVAERWNSSSIDFAEITMDRNFALLLVSLVSAMLWVVYITYYNSRVLGYILTRLINRFYFQDENFKIGSFTLNALSGKIMFCDIVYINYDYTLRIQDGYLIFRWWRSYVPKDVSEDLSHSDTRLSIMLNGFELHFYNRCDLYAELEKTFGLDPVIKQQHDDDDSTDRDKAMNDANEKRRRAQDTVRSEAAMARTWRDLIPVIKIDVCTGRVVFGNRLVPTTFSVSVEEAHLMYSTKPPASSLDHLMHFVKAKAENCKVMLAPSPNYTAMVDEPPRYMGEGFVVMSSNYIEVYFYMDEPGLVPEQPVLLQLANGDIVESAPPIWGLDIKCGKGTDFSYGPWADRQRDHLFRFFFPPDYKSLVVTPQPKPGDRRQMQSFDIRLSTLNEATIDILFTKNKETNAVHINIGAGSYLEVTLPWIVLQDGYTTKITGQLLHLEATTSLQYRSLAESETLEYTVKCHYPLVWNHHQCWQLSLTGCKATAHFVYTHIDFFQDLTNDWSSKARPDILHFVPYTWKISLLLKECEVVTLSNQYNWVDCSSTNQENNHVAFCGDLLDVSFDLPFVDFLPDVIPLKIWVQGEAVDMSLYLPEVNTSRLLLLSIDKNMKLIPCRLKASKWRRKCVKTQGWVDCWSVPIVALSVRYDYHPIPPLGPEPQADITTPEKEEILLSPIRIPRMRKQPQINWAIDGNNFDRTTLAPDKVSVELEVGPSILLAYGTIITSFLNLLENIFGEDQIFTDMQKAPSMETYFWSGENPTKLNDRSSINQHTEISIDENSDSSKGPFDPRRVRPLDVTVSIIIHDIQAHLVKNCSENEPPCPVILIERFGFEMDKSFRETKLQLLLSPSILVSSNSPSRSGSNGSNNSSALQNGHLMLSSFQLRGNGFFSDTNRSVEEDTVEYAWMMELQLGQLTGRLTLPQLYQIISSLETFLLLICDNENELTAPKTARQCHHGLNNVLCPETDLTLKYRCPTSNEIKYRMIRVAIDLIDLYIADTNTTLQSWLSPIRLSFCNLHGAGFGTGITGLLPNIKLALFTQTNMQANTHHHSSGSNGSQNKVPDNDNWVGVGSMSLGPLLIEAASSLPQSPKNMHLVQQKFMKLHDEKFKRLWFLWASEGKGTQCGCTGGCAFFGSNRNGANFLKPSPSDLHEGLNIAIFNVIETTPGEYGYGQSLLHQGQLVFHTPPYNSLNVCLQPMNVSTLIPSPLPQNLSKSPQSAERRSLTRRFSYTSVGKGSNNVLVSSTKSDVPYARLVDSSVPLGSSKIDSDSKLNKTILNVPQMESSVSDSKLTLSCGIKDGTAKKQIPPENDQFVVPRMPPRSVAVSESHYSLNSQHPHEDAVLQEVRRTMSITSENHSEAFFSADEDMFPSRSSSLKHSFGSRHSKKDKAAYAIADATNEKWLNVAARSELDKPPDTISNLSAGVQPDSESGSVSSNSFISAISSQEDMTLVNLHMQTNKPIVDSPLLMSSYMNNLPQYKCCNWATCSLPSGSDVFTLPLFRRAEDGSLVYVGQKYLPNFEPVGKVHTLKLIARKDGQSQNQHGPFSNLTPHFNSQIKAHPYPQAWWDLQQNVQDNQENTTDKSTASSVTTTSDSKNGLFVKLRGEIDVMLTPLVLESIQKFVESLTPVLANIHPITVINHLRLLCISSVESSNILKQKQYVLNWLPQMQARNETSIIMEKDDKCKLATIPHSNVYEETICDQLQATVTVPKVNIIFIQSSVVEDMISFSALDNIQDLTCVSLFGVSVENIVAKYASSRKTLESVQLYYRPTLRALGSKKSFGIMKGPRALISTQASGRKRGPEKGEPVYIETSQQQCEDTTITLNIGKVHGQLRRTRNDSSQLKDAAITGIPCQHSKVAFKFIRADSCAKGCDSMGCQNGASEGQKENAIGYIMFECGIEGVSVKVSKHSQSHKPNEEKKATRPDSESCKESIKSAEELKPDKEKEKSKRTSGIEDLFRKKESNSKPSTPNLGSAQPPQVPPVPPEPATPAPDEPSNDSAATVVPVKDSGNTSSCSIDLKVVWFNFAAPPRTPITKKIDYTRLDWNLLSTASPAINAWMNPCNRLGIRVVALYRARARRLAATAASLMASALDRAPTQTLPKSRYGRHTPMAKQLREEPSLQLCAVLLRYALQADAAAVQADLAERHLPSLSTLRQGVIVLTRQWKNILYTPLLLDHNYKSKVMRPLNVTFALPDLLEDSVEGWQEYQFDNEGLDENCLLLNMDVDKLVTSLPTSAPAAPARAHSYPSTPPSVRAVQSSRASLVFPSLPFTRKPPFQDDAIANYGTLKEDLPTVGSNPSLYSQGSGENISSDRAREDLYQWMAKQEPIKVEPKSKKPIIPASKMNPRAVAAAMPACSLYPLQGSLMLLDAHLVFQPFLSALGVSPHQVAHGESKVTGVGAETGSGLESLGSKLSLLAWVDVFRIDIVVGELARDRRHQNSKGKANVPQADIQSETPAFLCEKISIDVDLKKVADMAVDDLIQRQNVLYISRGQLKKHISTMLNFNISIRFISQQVNMPLLRLLHQISNMYQNVKDTQSELRTQTNTSRRHNKHPSVSDFPENVVSMSSLDKDSQYAVLDVGPKWDLPVTLGPDLTTVLGTDKETATPPRPRPQSFAQKLRSTGKTVKGKLGYSSLNEGAHTPMFPVEAPPAPPPAPPGAGQLAPRCWRTVYLLLDLYANMPDADTITHRFSVTTELPEAYRGRVRPSSREQNASNSSSSNTAMGMVVVGVARIHRTRLLASLSGLKLEAEITSLQASLSASRARQWSLSGNLGRTAIVLLEGPAPNHQTVVRVSVGKSQALYSWEGGRLGATALASIGSIRVDLPQHPVALHGVMTRSSRQLSSTLQELGVTRTSSRLSRGGGTGGGLAEEEEERSPPPAPRPPPPAPPPDPLLQPLQLQFSLVLQSLSVTAALLPSLQAQYKMERVHSAGVTAGRAHFTVDLPHHSLSFVTKLQVTEANIPAAASVALPAVSCRARVLDCGDPSDARAAPQTQPDSSTDGTNGAEAADTSQAAPEGVVLRAGRYLSATADIGLFEHTLSTDLLNHLVFVQKVFMKEVNEVVQKVYGGEKPVPLWNEEEISSSAFSRILFSLLIRIKRIQLTATTPSNSAVRLETGAVEFELSNRVQNVPQPAGPHGLRLFARAQVDVNLSLGQLIRNAMFEEAEPEFQQYAFFNTRIAMRNAFQDEIVCEDDKEVVLITLKRPLIYIQPVAVDKAILVWLNYKNAYEYWNEKRMSLTKEVLTATQQVFEKVQLTSNISPPHLSTLFLQLNVDDIGICLPLNQLPLTTWGRGYELDSRGAVVVTLESTSISACSSGSLVSKGRFVGLCLRFADDFEASLDDWKPDPGEACINVCCVSEGTYEVCSRTTAAKHNENAKWFLNVSWQMEGVDIHLDVNVGKQLSALGHTLTMLTGFEEEDPLKMDYESDLDDEADISKDSQESIVFRRKYTDHLPAFVFDTSIDAKKRSKLIEKEMTEQAKIINDLRALGASHSTVEYEMRRLHDLEALVFKDFRRDMIQKLRRQSVRASSITKGKLGLGSNRSHSFVSAPPPDVGLEPLGVGVGVSESGETLLLADDDTRLADIIEGTSWSSADSDPLTGAGPSRSSSLRGPRNGEGREGREGRGRVTFQGGVQRQSSLPAPWPPHLHLSQENLNASSTDTPGPSQSNESKQSKAKTAEPNIDFELDVKVHINSGKCVLHTKEPGKEEELKIGSSKSRVGRSASGGLGDTRRARLPPPPDLTVFQVPGLQLKVHYESKTLPEESVSPQTIPNIPLNPTTRKVGTKKASLFAWITLQSIPEETIISPHILEFLEQTLEPIPTKTSFTAPTSETENTSRNRTSGPPGEGSSEGVPGVAGSGEGYGQYVYASFPVDVIVHFHTRPSAFRFSCLPASRVECLLQLPSLQIVFSSKRASDEEMAEPAIAMGGLSVTGCLADFSVYIFHPYGGKKSSLKEAQWSPLADTERKDSLSINVEFVKFHLSRFRKLDFHTDHDSKATVRFSTIVDVGSAWFKYDMRRLSEILAFPKAWYRRSIVRRLFLGDVSVHTAHQTYSSNVPASPVLPQREKAKTAEPQKPKEDKSGGAAWETLVLFAVNFERLNVHMNMGNVMGNVSWQSRSLGAWGRLSIGSTRRRQVAGRVALGGAALEARGGIVGGSISLAAARAHVLLQQEPPAHVAALRLAALELRLEYMGAPALLARLSRLAAVLKDRWQPPAATPSANRPATILAHGTLSWHQLQIAISRSTTPDLLKMQLKLEEFFTQQFKSGKRVFSSLHSTAGPYQTRLPREKRDHTAAAAAAAGTNEPPQQQAELRHHRHWQKVLQLIAAAPHNKLHPRGTVLGGTLELQGSNISLACFHGNSLKAKSWALFSLKDPCISFATEAQQIEDEDGSPEVHAVQSLTASLGEGVSAGVGAGGAGGPAAAGHQSLATVCRMTRTVLFPPQFKTLHEWFHYAFADSEIDAIDQFPSLERDNTGTTGSTGSAGAQSNKPSDRHVREVIFALPALQMHLRTSHLQKAQPPTEHDDKPVVECSFITEFEDHIFVSVDAEAFLFLHDLISSYIKEKERFMPGRSGDAPAAPPVDFRDYRCLTWHLEPTVRLLSWAGKSIEPYGVDYILQKLGFSHARTTIPKWLQRGTLDPVDKLLALVLLRLVGLVPDK
ncbi:bridge-like lipid transfer protein family member 1 [Maniola hyperantus]|uniref:bridge-like lipid transfer protein family member 1 n=1 Tax=Aphantopus hyperantus TaxID=2795564 RepID=UPI00374A390B